MDGFIRLPSGKRREDDQSYRSITVRDPDSDSSSSSSSSEEGESSEDEDIPRTLTAREESIQRLESLLAEDPTSVSSWLLLLEQSAREIQSTSKNAERTRAEIALSVLTRAMEAHPRNKSSVQIRLKFLKYGEVVWSTDRMKEEWMKALREANSDDLAVEWLDWRIRTATSFNDALEEAESILWKLKEDENSSTDEFKLRLFWRAAVLMKQAGELICLLRSKSVLMYCKAMSSEALPFSKPRLKCKCFSWWPSFGMLIHHRIFKTPKDLKLTDFEQKLEAFEQFWDSEVPRLGDVGAKGWAAWAPEEELQLSDSPSCASPVTNTNPFDFWYESESKLDEQNFLPKRMDDESGDSDDPYSTILFSDIRPFLVDLRTSHAQRLFRCIWLSYMGLDIPGLSAALASSDASDDRWAETSLMRSSFLETLFPREHAHDMADSLAGVTIGREKVYHKLFADIKSWSLDVMGSLEGLSADGRYRLWDKAGSSKLDETTLTTIRYNGYILPTRNRTLTTFWSSQKYI